MKLFIENNNDGAQRSNNVLATLSGKFGDYLEEVPAAKLGDAVGTAVGDAARSALQIYIKRKTVGNERKRN